MYKEYFGLTNETFCRRSRDGSAFMSPQQGKTRARLIEALSSAGTVVTVTGPAGCGKSTLVFEALDGLAGTPVIARIARMQLGHDEVLELLLSELGVKRQPAGTIQRFTEFRRLLKEFESQDKHVFIVVEDAQRLGIDAITELESLTSASGASIVLMGPPEFDKLLGRPELARIKQRTRLRLSIEPLGANEIHDYLAHRLNIPGTELENVLDTSAVDLIYRYCGGIQRVIDNLCQAVLNAAASTNTKPVSSDLVQQIASKELRLEIQPAAAKQEPTPASTPAVTEQPNNIAEPAPASAPPVVESVASTSDEEIPHLIQDTIPGIEALPEAVFEDPSAVEIRIPAANPVDTNQPSQTFGMTLEPVAPEPLVRTHVDPNTLKDLDDALRPDTHLLQVLEQPQRSADDTAPVPLGLQGEMHRTPAAAPVQATPTAPIQDSGPPSVAPTARIPTLSDSMRIAAPVPAKDTSDSGDTMTLRKPNIKALESAMAAARKGPVDLENKTDAGTRVQSPTTPAAAPAVSPLQSNPNQLSITASLPEITLDNCLEKRQKEAEAKLREKAAATGETPKSEAIAEKPASGKATTESTSAVENNTVASKSSEADDEKRKQEERDRAQLDKLASELGNAKSLDEIDDIAAETLFGEEFSAAAAAVAAMVAADSANDSDMGSDKPVEQAVATGELVPNGSAASEAKPESPQDGIQSRPKVSPPSDVDSSTAERLAMVSALNSGGVPKVSPPSARPSTPAKPAPAPKPVEAPAPPAQNIVMDSATNNSSHEEKIPEKRGPQLKPIENQFGASMTQTLEALNMAKPSSQTTSDEDTKKSKPFLSRFKRS